MSQHTLGPWETWRGNQIKSVYGYPGMDESQLMPAKASPGVNAEANARLIAAAPDLLEACVLSLGCFTDADAERAANAMKAAVAKATSK